MTWGDPFREPEFGVFLVTTVLTMLAVGEGSAYIDLAPKWAATVGVVAGIFLSEVSERLTDRVADRLETEVEA